MEQLLKAYKEAYVAIRAAFDLGNDDYHFRISDLTDKVWAGGKKPGFIGWIDEGEEYGDSIVGYCFWENETHALAYLYDGSGGKAGALFSLDNRLSSEQWDELVEE